MDEGMEIPNKVGKEVSTRKLAKIVENNSEKDEQFWRSLSKEGQDSFERVIESVRETRANIIELMKINLLIGTTFAAIPRIGGREIVSVEPWWVALVPYGLLLAALFVLIFSYLKL